MKRAKWNALAVNENPAISLARVLGVLPSLKPTNVHLQKRSYAYHADQGAEPACACDGN
ncbi:MAG: hypothetical protein RLZZ187_973 [Pseudomonadota bacterium]|jgi:hypothetical protein